MANEPTAKAHGLLREPPDFSLVLGGPLFRLLRWSRLTGDALELVRRRVVVISLLCWLPLLVLSAFAGTAVGTRVTVPFLYDVEAQARFLVAVPLLIIAELVVHQRMRLVIGQFLERRLIPDDSLVRFEAAIDAAMRLRNSMAAEVALVLLVYGVGIGVIWRQYLALPDATWYAVPTPHGLSVSGAGLWYGLVSLPLFQFLLLRWYFRLVVWSRFLFQVSRLRLSLIPTHPDRMGGLGFLSNTVYAFVPVLAAHGMLLSGMLANRIFHEHAKLLDFKIELAVVVAFLLAVVLGPLCLLAPQLARAKREGLIEYGAFAERHVRAFDEKWLRGGAAPGEPLVGTTDLPALGNLGPSYAAVQSMLPVPVTRGALIGLAVAVIAPVVPLLLTMMPLEQLVQLLAKLVV